MLTANSKLHIQDVGCQLQTSHPRCWLPTPNFTSKMLTANSKLHIPDVGCQMLTANSKLHPVVGCQMLTANSSVVANSELHASPGLAHLRCWLPNVDGQLKTSPRRWLPNVDGQLVGGCQMLTANSKLSPRRWLPNVDGQLKTSGFARPSTSQLLV